MMHDRDWWQLDGSHYRELAAWLRELAGKCRLPNPQHELLRLARTYSRRAYHLDRRARRRGIKLFALATAAFSCLSALGNLPARAQVLDIDLAERLLQGRPGPAVPGGQTTPKPPNPVRPGTWRGLLGENPRGPRLTHPGCRFSRAHLRIIALARRPGSRGKRAEEFRLRTNEIKPSEPVCAVEDNHLPIVYRRYVGSGLGRQDRERVSAIGHWAPQTRKAEPVLSEHPAMSQITAKERGQ
jgi:hypothetical protein